MSDTKNHKKAIKAIIEARKTPGAVTDIFLQILADKPSAIANAWEEVKPVKIVMEYTPMFPEQPDIDSGGHVPRCKKCGVRVYSKSVLICLDCSRKLIP